MFKQFEKRVEITNLNKLPKIVFHKSVSDFYSFFFVIVK